MTGRAHRPGASPVARYSARWGNESVPIAAGVGRDRSAGPDLVQSWLLSSPLDMRLVALALLALAFAVPSQAQQAIRPSLRSTFVVPHHNGEAIRVTTFAARPPDRGRLSRRYRGLRANRSIQTGRRGVSARPVSRTVSSPRYTWVQRGGSFYQVVR